jgi:hypothetical protein
MRSDYGTISRFIQAELSRRGLTEVTAVEAAEWLDRAGLLGDSTQRKGKNLRRLLRDHRIPGAVRLPAGHWRIRVSSSQHEDLSRLLIR